MSLIDAVEADLRAYGVNCKAVTMANGTRMLGLQVPPEVQSRPLLLVLCDEAASIIAFAGQCVDEIPNDRYWDALAYVNAAIADTAIARMHLNEKNQIIFTSSPIPLVNGAVPASAGPAAMSFVLEACALSMGLKYIQDSLMKPRETVAHVLGEMRRQSKSGLL